MFRLFSDFPQIARRRPLVGGSPPGRTGTDDCRQRRGPGPARVDYALTRNTAGIEPQRPCRLATDVSIPPRFPTSPDMNHRDIPAFSFLPPHTKTVVWDRRRSPRHRATEHRLWLGWRTETD